MPWPDEDFPADPYPGAVPPGPYAHVHGVAYELPPEEVLDEWLAGHGAPPAAGRVPVLAYGSNRCPSKITWLRGHLGLGPDPVVVVLVRTTGVAAVWAAGLRLRDGQRPAVLAAAPGVVEEHAVWMATPEQVAVLDRCEGRDERFRLARLHTGEVRTRGGALIAAPWVYVGHATARRPLLVDGRPVRCVDVAQSAALGLRGDAAPGDGLDAPTVRGAPRPDEWPAALFAHGMLRPGQPLWRVVEAHAAGIPRAATAAVPDHPGSPRGVVVPIQDPAVALPVLDAGVGDGYRRVRVVLPDDGTVCWTYARWAPGVPG